ncbi:MAG: DNA translocase FtsK 4TM domain-containing protein [Myxococcales bacterium]|nr:DNA translocase FtsK 4TM domain-containing protein [Myxococcales bacterium]
MRKRRSKLEVDAVPELIEQMDEPVPNRLLEAVGLTFMLVAVALCFALGSFDPADTTGESNLVGQFGRRFADNLLTSVGVVGYLGALCSVGIAGAALFGKFRLPSILSMCSLLLLVASMAVSAHMLGGTILGKPAGGALGLYVGEKLLSAVGPVGSGLAVLGAILLGLMGAADASFVRLLRRLGGAIGGTLRAFYEGWADRRAARVAAHRRTKEVEAAARMTEVDEDRKEDRRRAMASKEAEAVARIAEADAYRREDRRRAMVMKAEAEAEARALQRIAEQREKQVPGVGNPVPAHSYVPPAALIVERIGAEDPPPENPQPVFALKNEPILGDFDVASFVEVPIDDGSPVAESSMAPPVETQDVPLDDPAAVLEQIDARVTEPRSLGDVGEPTSFGGQQLFSPKPVAQALSHLEKLSLPETPQNLRELAGPTMSLPLPSPDAHESEAPALPEEAPLIHERKVEAVRFDEDPRKLSRDTEKRVYQLPPLNLLDHEGAAPEPVNEESLRLRATRLEEKLETYGVRGKVTAIRPGPVVTTYEYEPAPGVKVAKIANLQDDIAMSMEALRVRIVAPIPGRGVVGIELPNEVRENVYLKEIAAHERFRSSKSLLTLALGKDAEGGPQVRDLQKMPHLLVAGTTGSGKSVSINTMILSMLYKATPDQVKFIMVDPKMLELSLYNDIPHLLLPVVTDPKQASIALQWTVDEMERRYKLLSDFKVRDLASFNKKLERLQTQRELEEEHPERVAKSGKIYDPWRGESVPQFLPFIVVLIDEFADLMTVAPRDVELSVQRLAQKARAAGIHVLLATQRPSTDVITGVIKNNFPCRLAFRVASRHDSATIINMPGAEALLGRGDSLMMDTTAPNPSRIHGSFVSEEEVERVVEFWKMQGRPVYDETILRPREDGEDSLVEAEDVDEHYDLAIQIVTETRKASISGLQRRLRVGYNRAARMIEMMEAQGIIGPAVGPKGEREVLVNSMPAPLLDG